MANNNVLYNAAYDGAVSGLCSRWINSEMIGNESTNRAIAATIVFATAFDSLIAPGSFNGEQAKLLEAICRSVWSQRMPISEEAGDYEQICETVLSLFTSLIGNLLTVPEPITLEAGQENRILGVNSAGDAIEYLGTKNSTGELVPVYSLPAITHNGLQYLQVGDIYIVNIIADINLVTLGGRVAEEGLGNFNIPPLFDAETQRASGFTTGTVYWTGGYSELSIDTFLTGTITNLDAIPAVGTAIMKIPAMVLTKIP